jgi:membrane-bound serine protease (ClpP class)
MIASLVTALYLLGFVSASTAAKFLFAYGIILLIAEIGVMSFGALAINGALAIYVAFALHTGNSYLGFPVDWPLLFGIAFTELFIVVAAVIIIRNYRRIKVTTGTEAMRGQKGVVLSWAGTTGTVLIDGEIWQAYSDHELFLRKDDEVIAQSVDGLKVKVSG